MPDCSPDGFRESKVFWGHPAESRAGAQDGCQALAQPWCPAIALTKAVIPLYAIRSGARKNQVLKISLDRAGGRHSLQIAMPSTRGR